MKTKPTANLLASLAVLGILATVTLRAATVRIVQTNAAGDSVMLIDPVTNKVVGEIPGIEVNHGAAVAPDGSRFYITNEAESTLDVADGRTLKVVKHIPLTNHPNNVSVSKDGKRVYVAIVAGSGAVDVIDQATEEIVWTLPTDEGVRPIAFDVNPDGSTKRMFVQLSGFNGFIIVDFA